MKRYLFLFTFFLILPLVSCFETTRDCQSFKNGTFQFEAIVGTTVESTTFIRNDSMEIDLFRGKKDTSSIRWINDCEYILEKIKPANRSERKAVHVKILSTHGDAYTFEYNIVGSKKKQQGKAVKID
jgi:hypothetical protein